jgi:hypothetical protein
MQKSNSFFIKVGLALLFALNLSSCRSDRSKAELARKSKVCGGLLFAEDYVIAKGGAYGGDRESDYLTDSINFRIYVGTVDNKYEYYAYKCSGDSVIILHFKYGTAIGEKSKLLGMIKYNVVDLKKKKLFE